MIIKLEELVSRVGTFANQIEQNKTDSSKVQSIVNDIRTEMNKISSQIMTENSLDLRVGARQPNEPPGFKRIEEIRHQPDDLRNPLTGQVRAMDSNSPGNPEGPFAHQRLPDALADQAAKNDSENKLSPGQVEQLNADVANNSPPREASVPAKDVSPPAHIVPGGGNRLDAVQPPAPVSNTVNPNSVRPNVTQPVGPHPINPVVPQPAVNKPNG